MRTDIAKHGDTTADSFLPSLGFTRMPRRKGIFVALPGHPASKHSPSSHGNCALPLGVLSRELCTPMDCSRGNPATTQKVKASGWRPGCCQAVALPEATRQHLPFGDVGTNAAIVTTMPLHTGPGKCDMGEFLPSLRLLLRLAAAARPQRSRWSLASTGHPRAEGYCSAKQKLSWICCWRREQEPCVLCLPHGEDSSKVDEPYLLPGLGCLPQ